MEFAILLSFIACLMLRNYNVSRSVLYPPFLFSAMWLLVLSLYRAGFVEVNPLHGKLMLLLGLGALSFSAAGELARLVPRQLIGMRLRIGDSLGNPRTLHLTKVLILAAAFIGMLFMAHGVFSRGLQGGSGSILANARNAGIETSDSAGFSVLAYVPVWSICSAALFLIERKDRLFWLMALIAFMSAVLTTGRGPILELFGMLTAVELFKANRLKFLPALRYARIPILIFLTLYIVLIFTNKNTSGMEGGIVGIAVYFVVSYLIAPTAAMDYVLQHAGDYAHQPIHTFKFPLQVGAALHLWSYTPPPFLDAFIQVPFPANVYTGYKFYFTDFGFAGCILAVGIIGFLQTLLYRKALTGSSLGIYLYSFTVFPLVMFIFDDVYSATGEMLNVILFGCLYMVFRSIRFLPATDRPGHYVLLPQGKSTLRFSIFPRMKKSKL
jgi:oligosaccharide repeat unit polymerase